MKIIFLDIDGVLNSMNGLIKRGGQSLMDLYVEHIAILREILYITDARIVISSTWRKGRTVEQLKQLFYNYELPSKYIIDKTPSLKGKEIVINGKTYSDTKRGHEIEKWLEDNKELDIEEFVILDDDSDMANLMDKLVQTDYDYGLTYIHAEEVIKRLSGKTFLRSSE